MDWKQAVSTLIDAFMLIATVYSIWTHNILPLGWVYLAGLFLKSMLVRKED